MKRFIVYDSEGQILRSGGCPNSVFLKQARDGQFVMEGAANDVTQKIEFDGFDEKGQPVNPRVVNKTPEEIEVDNPAPPEISFEKRTALITNEQWQQVQDRLGLLESK